MACGGFSYGDVLGAGEGWAKSILFNESVRAGSAFFEREDTFTLGVCNGCQMVSALKELIPGAALWPRFVRNRSEQFEARLALVRVESSPSILLSGMAGSHLPIAVAHGEGRAQFASAQSQGIVKPVVRWSCAILKTTLRWQIDIPLTLMGLQPGITGLTSEDGRATIMMPHPERVYRTIQHSWTPPQWGEDGGWLRMFRNARRWLG